MKVLFLDESGDHNLAVIDPQHPLFVLGGIIVDKDYAEGAMTESVWDFKRSLFGRDDIILHTADITRNRNGFEAMTNTAGAMHPLVLQQSTASAKAQATFDALLAQAFSTPT